MKYHFKIYKEGRGFWAECLELEGLQTQGSTKKELMMNMEEALNLYLDEPEDSKVIFPLPNQKIRKASNIVDVHVYPAVAFSFFLRNSRLKQKLTQNQVREKLGLKNIYSYQRLESSQTANPELKTIVALKRIFPEMDLEEIVA